MAKEVKRSSGKPRKNTHRLEFPSGEPNLDAVRALVKECLVPMLAEEFLRCRRAAVKPAVSEVTLNDPTFKAFDREGGL
jgi:hypothetical protein